MIPSEKKRLEFPDLVEENGEAAVQDAVTTLDREAIGAANYEYRDDTIKSRIRGIDRYDRIRLFVAVENRTRGRREVLEALSQRRDRLDEIGDRDDRLEDVDRELIEDDVDQDADEDPVVEIHEACGSVVERQSAMACYCPECEQRTNRVEEVDYATIDESPDAVLADGGSSS